MFANFTRKQSLMNTNYTNEEICALYREAANKKTQIGILAELTLKTKGQIKEILRENGFDVERLREKGVRARRGHGMTIKRRRFTKPGKRRRKWRIFWALRGEKYTIGTITEGIL